MHTAEQQVSHFEEDRQVQVARQAFLWDEAQALAAYAAGYVEDQELDPELERPTPESLARWMYDDQCPPPELAISQARLTQLFQAEAEWVALVDGTATAVAVQVSQGERMAYGSLVDVFRLWHEGSGKEGSHPMAPLLKAWFTTRPRPVPASSRATNRIIPAKLAMAPTGDRRGGKRFSVAAHVEFGPDNPLVMPGFHVDRQAPALPLAWYELGEAPSQRTKAAPLALRLLLTSIFLVRQQDRGCGQPVALNIRCASS